MKGFLQLASIILRIEGALTGFVGFLPAFWRISRVRVHVYTVMLNPPKGPLRAFMVFPERP